MDYGTVTAHHIHYWKEYLKRRVAHRFGEGEYALAQKKILENIKEYALAPSFLGERNSNEEGRNMDEQT